MVTREQIEEIHRGEMDDDRTAHGLRNRHAHPGRGKKLQGSYPFVASCIEDVANRLGVDYAEVYKRMDAVRMIDQYLIPFYSTLHTESRENLTDSLIGSLNRIIEGGIANDRVIDTIRLYMFGDMEKSTALKRLAEHQSNHQICILNQEVADKYLKSIESVEL